MNFKILKVSFIVIATLVLGALIVFYIMKWQAAIEEKQFESIKTEDVVPKKEIKHVKSYIDKQDPKIKQVDDYLKQQGFNGSITILENNKVKLNQGYGYRDFETGQKNNPDSMYLIGSSQKFTTGILLKQLEVEGKVDMQAPVTTYIPWFKTDQPITLNDLMLHQSGLKKYRGNPEAHNLDEAVHYLQQEGIQPGMYKKHMYNDGNYIVLAKVIEEVTGEPFASYFTDKLVKPLNLDHTAFYNDPAHQEWLAHGYKLNQATRNRIYPKFLSQYYGAGNLYMSTHDMATLITSIKQAKVLPKSVAVPFISELGTAQYPKPYRFGFYVYEDYRRVNGLFFGFQHTAYFNNRYTIVIATNFQLTPRGAEDKLKHIFTGILHQRLQK